jgi:hypothetical protein
MKNLIKDIIWFIISIQLNVDFVKAEVITKNAYKRLINYSPSEVNIHFSKEVIRAVLFYNKVKFFLD